MKKLSQITESIWSDIQDRSAGENMRQEEGKIVLKLDIDGVTYKFSNVFMSMGEEYEEENSEKWKCFAFNIPDDGSTLIHGNTEDVGAFGMDRWDIGEDTYDVYVIRDYIDKTSEDIINELIDNGDLNEMPIPEVKDLLLKYTRKILEDNHMSEYAYYQIYELWPSDWSHDTAIFINVSKDDMYDMICDEFEDEDAIEEIHCIIFPMLDNWYEDLEKEITVAYQKLGWIMTEDSELLDPHNGPGDTAALCFVKFVDGYVPSEHNDDEEDEEDAF